MRRSATLSPVARRIPDDIIGKVFEPFFSTKQNHKGSGLGLSQVHGFAHQSSGMVAIESHVGEGTVVTLYLPRSGEGPARNSPEQVPSVPGGTALLVEDNPEVAVVTKDVLDQLGYAAPLVEDAMRAFDLIGDGL